MDKEEMFNLFDKYRRNDNSYALDRYDLGTILNCIIKEYELLIKNIEAEHKINTSILEAKVYAYEKIIANSNFKTVLEEPKSNTNKDMEALKKGEDIKEIPQFQGTLEQLDKLSIRGENNV